MAGTLFENNLSPYLTIVEATEPSAPSAGQQRLYIDSTTHLLKATNSSGTDRTIEGSSGALVFLEAHTATNASPQLDFTSFISSTYDTYKLIGNSLVPATNAASLSIEAGSGGGPTYDTGSNYEWVANGWSSDGTARTSFGSSGVPPVFNGMANAAGYGFGSFELMLYNPQSTALRKIITGNVQFVSSAPDNRTVAYMWTWTTTATAMTALRFIMSSGNIVSGTIRAYGVAKS